MVGAWARTYRRMVLIAYPRIASTSTKSSTQRLRGSRSDLLADVGANRKRFKHGLLLGPRYWGPTEDHAYYVKRVAAPTPATPGATVLR